MKAVLDGFGVSEGVTQHALELDAILQAWRRRMQKRELGQMALAELGLPLDLPKLDVMVAIWAPSNEFGSTGQEETMVATIAARARRASSEPLGLCNRARARRARAPSAREAVGRRSSASLGASRPARGSELGLEAL